MRKIRGIAAAQTVPARGDVEANTQQHLRLVQAAAEHGVHVVVFPELSLTGYELGLAKELCFSTSDERLMPLSEAARTHSIIIVAGAPVRLDDKLHIGAFIVYPEGEVDLYTKHHLGAFSPGDNPDGPVPPPEATVFEPGDSNPLVRLGKKTGAVAICADWTRPSHPSDAAARGAKVYLAGMFTIPNHVAVTMAGLKAYAEQHAFTVVYANYGGPTGGLASAGRSAIWSDSGELLVQLGPTGTGLALATERDGQWRAEAFAPDTL
jgi:predicted amidohydrolase